MYYPGQYPSGHDAAAYQQQQQQQQQQQAVYSQYGAPTSMASYQTQQLPTPTYASSTPTSLYGSPQQPTPSYAATTSPYLTSYPKVAPTPARPAATTVQPTATSAYGQYYKTPTTPSSSTGIFPIPTAAKPKTTDYMSQYNQAAPALSQYTTPATQVATTTLADIQRQQAEIQRQQQQLELQKQLAASMLSKQQQQLATQKAQQLALQQRQQQRVSLPGTGLLSSTSSYDSGLPAHLRSSSSSASRSLDRGRDKGKDSLRDRDRRDIDRRPRLPPPRLLPPKRHREPRRSSPPRRESSVVPTAADLTEYSRSYKSLKSRYPNLYVPTDFSFLESCWTRTIRPRGPTPRPLFVAHEAVDFEVTNYKQETAEDQLPPEAAVSASGKRYNVRVALLNAIPSEDLVNTYVPHLARQLKFLVQEKEESESSKYLSMIGGTWTSEDGGDPDNDLEPLIKTAIRTTREFCGVNLDQVLKWSVLGKIHYIRPQEERHGKIVPRRDDVTVILVPHLSHWDPSFFTTVVEETATETPAAAENEPVAAAADATEDMEGVEQTTTEVKAEEGGEETKTEEAKAAPEKPAKKATPGMVQKTDEGVLVSVVTNSKKIKARLLSLDGLLDYRPSDKMEKTFEVSICAEMCKEMLQRDFATIIYHHLVNAPDRRKEREDKKEKEREAAKEKEKRERDKEEEVTTSKTKKPKLEDGTAGKDGEKEETAEDKEKDKKDKEKDTFRVLVNPVLYAAYRFFDRTDKGALPHHELEDIMHCLNTHITQKQVRNYLDNASSSSASTRVYYKDFTHVESKEGDTKSQPEFEFSSDFAEDVAEEPVEVPVEAVPAATTENFTHVANLMARLDRSEALRRNALNQVSHNADEVHRLKERLDEAEKKYAELSVAAHANDAFFGEKIKESNNLKQILNIIKAAIKRAEEQGIEEERIKEERAAAAEASKEEAVDPPTPPLSP